MKTKLAVAVALMGLPLLTSCTAPGSTTQAETPREAVRTEAPEYFLLHVENCYDRRFENACVVCHESKGREWARGIVERWLRPVELDH